jgi:SulP family sulfate permease
MRRVDAAAFLSTAVAVLLVNAVAAVAIGCSIYVIHSLYKRYSTPLSLHSPSLEISD